MTHGIGASREVPFHIRMLANNAGGIERYNRLCAVRSANEDLEILCAPAETPLCGDWPDREPEPVLTESMQIARAWHDSRGLMRTVFAELYRRATMEVQF